MMELLQSKVCLSNLPIAEQPVVFNGKRGQLRGILTSPVVDKGIHCKRGVVFSHGWSGNRCGPTGLYTDLARGLALQGYICLRFDFSGRGESDGAGLETSLMTMGDDFVDAIHFFRQETGIVAPYACGLCSGGNVVIGCLNCLPELAGLVMLSVYPFSDGDQFQRDAHRTFYFIGIYICKACSLETWQRLFQGQLHFKNILNVLFGHFFRHGLNKKKETAGGSNKKASVSGQSRKAAPEESRGVLEKKEAPVRYLRELRADLPMLMLYGHRDPDAKAALKYFGDYSVAHALPVEYQEIEDANHNFSSVSWRTELLKRVLVFLQKDRKSVVHEDS